MGGISLAKKGVAMRRFFVDSVSTAPILRDDAHKHLSVVLRAKPGEEVILCPGDGKDYVCRIEEIRRTETVLSLLRVLESKTEPTVSVTLFSSVMKGDKNDWVVQKAVELGVHEIYPLHTRYVQNHNGVKTERLNRISLEASQQCGRSMRVTVHDAITFAEIKEILPSFDLVVFPYEKAEKPTLQTFLRENSREVHRVAIIVGSEGGFSEEEAELLVSCGVTPVTLGKRILRAETANIAVLSAVMYEMEQWQ